MQAKKIKERFNEDTDCTRTGSIFLPTEIQATDMEPIKLGKNPAVSPPKNPHDCDIFFERGDYEETLQCYSNTIMLNPNDAEAWNYKGFSLFQMGRLD